MGYEHAFICHRVWDTVAGEVGEVHRLKYEDYSESSTGAGQTEGITGEVVRLLSYPPVSPEHFWAGCV